MQTSEHLQLCCRAVLSLGQGVGLPVPQFPPLQDRIISIIRHVKKKRNLPNSTPTWPAYSANVPNSQVFPLSCSKQLTDSKKKKAPSSLSQASQLTERAVFTKPETKKPGACKNARHRVERGVTSEPAPGDKCYFYSAGRTANTDSPPDLLAAAQRLWRCGSARGQSLQQEQSGAASLCAALEAAEGLTLTKTISLTQAVQNSSRRAGEHRGQALSFLHRHPYVLGKLTEE